MYSLYLTLIAVLVSGLGARDQVTMGQLTESQGQRPAVLVIGLLIAVATSVAAAWAAATIAPMLVPRARIILATIALAFAGAESLAIAPGRRPKEPTRSLFAFTAVLFFHQFTDAARFLIFAIGVGTNAFWQAGVGGAIAGAALLGLAWAKPNVVLHSRWRLLRRAMGLVLLPLGTVLLLRAMDLV